MQLRFFALPALADEAEAEALNQFLNAVSVLRVEKQLVAEGAASYWAIAVTYLDRSTPRPTGPRRPKLDYREVLPEAEFAVYARLRALRKEVAEAEGVPAYALFTNEQLAAMVQRRVASLADLREIGGVGDARIEKYGRRFLALLLDGAANATPAEDADEA
jgi:superfamily II DNA helicase RecQ